MTGFSNEQIAKELQGNLMGQAVARLKQRTNRILIGLGIRNPGSKNRHNWVGAGHHEMKRQFQLGYLRSMDLSPQATFLDLGCGTLRGGIPIIEFLEAGKYTGVDVRPQVIAEARKELSEHGLEPRQPELLTLDEMKKRELGPFDVVWAFQVLIHMDESHLDEALQLVRRQIKPGGVFLATALIGPFEEAEWQGFPVVRRPLAFYEQKAAQFGFSVSSRGTLDSLGYGKQGGKPSDACMMEFRPDGEAPRS